MDEKMAGVTVLALSAVNKVVGFTDDVSTKRTSDDTSDTGVDCMRLCELVTVKETTNVGVS
jgi:hypothetical protein